jgi:hypothetical protein
MPDDAAFAETQNPAVLRAEWRLRMLEELAQMEMDLARSLHRQAIAAADPVDSVDSVEPATPGAAARPAITPNSAGDPSAGFARIARSLRLTLTLQARADEQLRALGAGVAAEAEARRVAARKRVADAAATESRGRRDKVERLVFEAAEREIDDDEVFGDVIEALEERLEQDEAYQDLDQAPLREIVERLCADLELTPDWSHWVGEGWAPPEPFFRPKLSVWRRPSRRPLFRLEAPSHLAQVPGPGSRRLE